MTKFIALLPMKENSEWVTRKNFRELVGKLLFYFAKFTFWEIA